MTEAAVSATLAEACSSDLITVEAPSEGQAVSECLNTVASVTSAESVSRAAADSALPSFWWSSTTPAGASEAWTEDEQDKTGSASAAAARAGAESGTVDAGP